MTAVHLETRQLVIKTGDRVLFQNLTMSLGNDRVAVVGRNGCGKSTLLRHLAGWERPCQGEIVTRARVHLVPQPQQLQGASPGELQKWRLEQARQLAPDLLLLDEPTQHLDSDGIQWLREWLGTWGNGLMVVSHEPALLQDFEYFFLVSEGGCSLFHGSFGDLEKQLELEHQQSEERYLQRLNQMVRNEEHVLHVARRRARKKRYGRVRELDRATPRSTLNQKRDAAQVSHGRMKRQREAKLEAVRDWALSARRALKVDLPLEFEIPELPDNNAPVLEVQGLAVTRAGHTIVQDLDLSIHRQRWAVLGPNGSGKTTLLEVLAGLRRPARGTARISTQRIGFIAQGGRDWMGPDSLLKLGVSSEQVALHRFPLALAQRPMHSLSPGERVRAALIALLSRPIELLILDEPTYSLDLQGRRSLTRALAAWPGGLVIASHDELFLEEVGIQRSLNLSVTSPSLGWSERSELSSTGPGAAGTMSNS